jgi:hypothetical protein
MLNLGYKKAHKFVTEQQKLGNNVEWRGWDMVFFTPKPSALYSVDDQGRPNGVWNRSAGCYGFETIVSPDDKGLWRIDYRNIVRPDNRIRS